MVPGINLESNFQSSVSTHAISRINAIKIGTRSMIEIVAFGLLQRLSYILINTSTRITNIEPTVAMRKLVRD